jgi:hypothetical protein
LSSLKISAPEDTVTQMARRAYEEYARQHRSGLEMRFPKWKDLTIAVKANWKQIVGKSLGMHGTIVNVNPMNREPYTVVLTGLTKEGMESLQSQMQAKMGAVNKSTIGPQPQENPDEHESDSAAEASEVTS